jgi:hypothetical protein
MDTFFICCCSLEPKYQQSIKINYKLRNTVKLQSIFTQLSCNQLLSCTVQPLRSKAQSLAAVLLYLHPTRLWHQNSEAAQSHELVSPRTLEFAYEVIAGTVPNRKIWPLSKIVWLVGPPSKIKLSLPIEWLPIIGHPRQNQGCRIQFCKKKNQKKHVGGRK